MSPSFTRRLTRWEMEAELRLRISRDVRVVWPVWVFGNGSEMIQQYATPNPTARSYTRLDAIEYNPPDRQHVPSTKLRDYIPVTPGFARYCCTMRTENKLGPTKANGLGDGRAGVGVLVDALPDAGSRKEACARVFVRVWMFNPPRTSHTIIQRCGSLWTSENILDDDGEALQLFGDYAALFGHGLFSKTKMWD
ncbi:hypothetical protein BDD12DRAFT_882285 [Trichophaea hybrida]|nr:hypothetical protein BDD12DRAFT_882285 [Trichophaea hybrida]